MAFAVQELSWFRQLGRLVGAKKTDKLEATEMRQCPFELADAMEQGIAIDGLSSGFLQAAPRSEKSQRMLVSRSEDRSEWVLRSEAGDTLLMARSATDGKKFDFYIPIGGDPPMAVGPAFTLATVDADRQAWTLSDRCNCCAYSRCCKTHRRDLLRIRHSREMIGEGSAMCMEVDLPSLQANDMPSVWCEQGAREQSQLSLVSKRPRWSASRKSLTLDFRGRCNKASAKNVQLQMEGAPNHKGTEPELLFGKIGDNTFVLDYRRPLGMAQAFAIALSVNGWH